MDPQLRRRYLRAMGVRVWRLRAGEGTESDAGRDEEQAAAVTAEPETGREPHTMVPNGGASGEVPYAASPGGGAEPFFAPTVVGVGDPRLADTRSDGLAPPADAGETAAPRAELPPLWEGEEMGWLPDSVSGEAAGDEQAAASVAAMDWERLQAAVAACTACPQLCANRTQTVFGVGARDADLMVIGEAPGADEDRQGEPFVGRAGQLLDLMLQAIGLARERVYIANILKCRPPGNRDPRPEEALRCRAFLQRQVALVRPKVLLSVGRISAQNLLETDETIGRLRGRWYELGPNKVPLIATYHPSYLLRSPEHKAKAWQDLQQVARRLLDGRGGD